MNNQNINDDTQLKGFLSVGAFYNEKKAKVSRSASASPCMQH